MSVVDQPQIKTFPFVTNHSAISVLLNLANHKLSLNCKNSSKLKVPEKIPVIIICLENKDIFLVL